MVRRIITRYPDNENIRNLAASIPYNPEARALIIENYAPYTLADLDSGSAPSGYDIVPGSGSEPSSEQTPAAEPFQSPQQSQPAVQSPAAEPSPPAAEPKGTGTSNMFCPDCGTELLPNTQFCYKCGKKFEQGEEK